jgi:hypothetical protein
MIAAYRDKKVVGVFIAFFRAALFDHCSSSSTGW